MSVLADAQLVATLDRLNKKLTARQRRVRHYRNWRDGKHPLAFATQDFRDEFGAMFDGRDGEAWHDNWCDLIVQAKTQRLEILSFDYAGDLEGGRNAMTRWRGNALHAWSDALHEEASTCGAGFYIVGPGRDHATITVEDADQVIVECDPETGQRTAALKRWRGEDGHWYATLYLPTGFYRLRSERKVSDLGRVKWRERPRVEAVIANPFGVVPVIPVENRPIAPGDGGRSDIAQVIPIQRALNKLFADMLVASEFAAYRQKWATGVETGDDGYDGEGAAEETKEEAQFRIGIQRILTLADPSGRFGEFGATDLGNYVKAIELGVKHVAAKVQVPPQYFAGQLVNVSGEGVTGAEVGHIVDRRRAMRFLGLGHAEAHRIACLFEGDRVRGKVLPTVRWANPETHTEAELADAALKRRQLGLPRRAVWAFLNYSTEEMDEMEADLKREVLELDALSFGAGAGEQGLPNEQTGLWLPSSAR